MSSIIYIIYNADGSMRGKIGYAYRKLTAGSKESPCSACDLTHAGLNLTETKEWTSTRAQIGADVKQLHRDEIDDEVKNYVKTNNLRYPLVLGRADGQELQQLMSGEDLIGCPKDHKKFLELLRERTAEKNIPLSEESSAAKI
ncbi:hypothetical protein MMC25_004139 [Agyrium rufum]|nr:hypothetical protein [Agyrium rufum]